MKIRIDDKHAKDLTFQTYGPQTEIAGVFLEPLTKHRGLNGSFMECLRLTGGQVEGLDVPFEVRQASLSCAAPGRMNAFHVHPKVQQDELWCVVQGRMLVHLVDIRADSPTCGNRRRYVLSGEAPGMLHIPTGVAHGYKAGPEGAMLLYVMNSQFNADDANEGRLPWDAFGAELWDEDRG